MSPTFQAVPETPAHVEIWDDDMFAAAFEGAAGDLLDEYVRSAEEQTARDEIAGKVALLIASASEAGFSDEARRFNLIDQLISRLGLLCDHAHIQECWQTISHRGRTLIPTLSPLKKKPRTRRNRRTQNRRAGFCWRTGPEHSSCLFLIA